LRVIRVKGLDEGDGVLPKTVAFRIVGHRREALGNGVGGDAAGR
jgi:hypothetical protein